MAHQNHEKWICDLLHGNNQAFPDYSDLTGWWRLYPPEASDPNHPEHVERMEWLALAIVLTQWKPWAREGLLEFHRALLADGEPVPTLLEGWVQDQSAQRKRGPGRPEEVNRDLRVLVGFTSLSDEGHTRNEAIDIIADCMNYSPETIRSIIHKHRGALPHHRR